MKWLQSVFRGSEKEIQPAFQALLKKFGHFSGLLEKNNQVLKIIGDLEEKTQGEYLFDLQYIMTRINDLRSAVSGIVESMIALGGQSYLPLRDRYAFLNAQIEEFLPGKRPVIRDHLTIPFSGLGRERVSSVGGKNAQLGELKRRGLPVPDGFAISAWAYHHFMDINNLQDRITTRLKLVNLKSLEELERTSEEIQSLVRRSEIPDDLAKAIDKELRQLQERTGAQRFALRSSAVGEDTHFSFAGQYATFLSLRTEEVLARYPEILASKFSPKAIYYLLSHDLKEADLPMSVGCMTMVEATSSGVIYTQDPVYGNPDCVIVHSLWGLGPYLVEGTLTPDVYRVRRKDGTLLSATPSVKVKRLVAANYSGTIEESVPPEEQASFSLGKAEIDALTDLALKIESHAGCAQDIEWAIDRHKKPFVLQARPLRILAVKRTSVPAVVDLGGLKPLMSGGITVCPGAGGGPVYHASSPQGLADVPEGAVLVAPQPFPGLVTALGSVKALVTQVGSAASHMATIAREYRIPTLTGLTSAGDLPSGIQVTVDATEGVVYSGLHEDLIAARRPEFELLEDTEIMVLLKSALAHIAPLSLINPGDSRFTIENCHTFHDLTRYAHQKAMEEMFSGARSLEHKDRVGLRLKSDTIPLTVDVISIEEQPLQHKHVNFLEESEITSKPMIALWEGIKQEGWPKTPPADIKGFMTVMANNMLQGATPEFSENSYAVLSREYMLLSLRMGYHFTTIEALCTEAESKNYIRVQYKAGGAPLDRRLRRIKVITALLTEMGFESSSKGDFLDAVMTYGAAPLLLTRLRQLGRISMMTKQLDMALSDDSIAEWYTVDFKKRLQLSDAGENH
jgi:pyruvate,water dikinase